MDEYSVFKEISRRYNKKITRQRSIIVRKVFSLHKHFTADELYKMLRSEYSGISRATVYRTLRVLVDMGFVEEREFGRGKKYYEHIIGHDSHSHFVCLKCGRIFEFPDERIEKEIEIIAGSMGFKIEKASTIVYGICKECQGG